MSITPANLFLKDHPIRKKIWKRVLLVLSALIVYYLFGYLMDPETNIWDALITQPFSVVAGDLAFAIIVCTLVCEASLFVDKKLNQKLPWTQNPARRLTAQALIHILNSLLFTVLIYASFSLFLCQEDIHLNQKEIRAFFQWLVTTTSIAFLISAVTTGDFILENWKKSTLEVAEQKVRVAEIQRAAAEAELQSLQLQLDPHFVFNNLSVLSELILEDQQLGHEYAENFAKVYRYLLVNSKRDLIPLEDEIRFLKAYLFLIKNRIGDGICFDMEIAAGAMNRQIPPMVLQLLIENAIKHNCTSRQAPLVINIDCCNDSALRVRNCIRPVLTKSPSAGIGLRNVMSRYALLTDKQPSVEQTRETFTVTIPLI